jgi:mannose-6-phosphate isomerase-like protein (cupin superfamily)
MKQSRDIAGVRRTFDLARLPMQPYDLDGPLQENMLYAALSYDPRTQRGSYLMRMQPGAVTIHHTHASREEFLVLEGELIESDGTVLNAGDWIVYEPGSDHHTRTEIGCLLLGIDWDPSPA